LSHASMTLAGRDPQSGLNPGYETTVLFPARFRLSDICEPAACDCVDAGHA
jgi:hypothetical protein